MFEWTYTDNDYMAGQIVIQTDGCIVRQVDRMDIHSKYYMDGQIIEIQTDRWIYSQEGRQVKEWTKRQIDGWTDRQIEGWIDEWMNGRYVRQTDV